MKLSVALIERSEVVIVGVANAAGLRMLGLGEAPVLSPIGRELNLRLVPRAVLIWFCLVWRYRTLRHAGFQLRVAYLASGVRRYSARLVVTYVDEACEFYYLKYLLPKTNFVSIQNGFRGPYPLFDGLRLLARSVGQPQCDLISAWTENFAEKYRDLIDARIVVTGSILNNFVPKTNSQLQGRCLAFASTFFPMESLREMSERISEPLVRDHARQILEVASQWCVENGYELVVLGRFPGEEEINFYTQAIGHVPRFLDWHPVFRNVANLEEVDLVLSCSSSLGLESVGRGRRTAICWPPSGSWAHLEGIDWFSGLDSQGPFWTSSCDKNEIRRVLDFITQCDDSEWRAVLERCSSRFCLYDPDNEILKQELRSLM